MRVLKIIYPAAGSIHTGFLDISFDDLELDREDSDYYATRPASFMSSSVSSTTFTSSSAVGLNKKKTHKVLRKEDEDPLFVASKSAASVYDPEATPTTMNFEDMIRSGDTVKVTLTPNRLRSIEVKNQMTDDHPPAPTWERRSTTSLRSRSSRSALRSTSPTPSASIMPTSRELPTTRPSTSSSSTITSSSTTTAPPLPSPPTTSRSSPFVSPKKPVAPVSALPTPPGPSPSVSTPSVTLTPAPTPVITTTEPPSPPTDSITTTTCDHDEECIKEEKQQSSDNDSKPTSPITTRSDDQNHDDQDDLTTDDTSVTSDDCSDNTITTTTAAAVNSSQDSSNSSDEKSVTTKPPSPHDSVASLSSTKSSKSRDSVVSLSSTSSSGCSSAVTAQEEQSGESDNNTCTTPIPRQPPIRQRKVSRGSKAWESIEEHAITPAAAARRRLVRQSITTDTHMEQQVVHNPPKATPQPRPLSSVLDKVMHFERSMDEFAAQQHHRQHRASAYYPRRERFLYLQREPGTNLESTPRRPLRRRPVTSAAIDVSVQTATIHEKEDDDDDATRAVVGWLLGEA